MDYRELVSSLEFEGLEHPGERVGELLAQGATGITALHNRSGELEADVEELLQGTYDKQSSAVTAGEINGCHSVGICFMKPPPKEPLLDDLGELLAFPTTVAEGC